MGTWPIYKKKKSYNWSTQKKLSFDKISPHDFYFFSFLFNLYLFQHFTEDFGLTKVNIITRNTGT